MSLYPDGILKNLFSPKHPDETITTFLFQYYGAHPIPDEIILSEEIEDMDYLEKHLEESKKGAFKILGPKNRSVTGHGSSRYRKSP